MADRRICFAGDLTSDAIGKTVFFEVQVSPTETRTYLDTLQGVSHHPDGTSIYLASQFPPVYVSSEGTTVEVRRSPKEAN